MAKKQYNIKIKNNLDKKIYFEAEASTLEECKKYIWNELAENAWTDQIFVSKELKLIKNKKNHFRLLNTKTNEINLGFDDDKTIIIIKKQKGAKNEK